MMVTIYFFTIIFTDTYWISKLFCSSDAIEQKHFINLYIF